MNPADQRVTELVDKWLKSLELHLKYATLTDEAYWQVQPWVRHQRPARWILDLAHARARELKRQIEERAGAEDAGFAEALELMAFLANLVGVQNIERFIPLAEPERENREVLAQTQSTLSPLNATATQARPALEATREMRMPPPVPPGEVLPPERPAREPAPAPPRPPAVEGTPSPAPVAHPPPAPSPAKPAIAARGAAKRETRAPAGKHPRLPADGSPEAQIVADAVRLLKWGREWHELPEAIARIAGRPGVVEVRKCLRTFKSEIEKGAAE